MDFGSLKTKYRLSRRNNPNSERLSKTKSVLTSILTCCKRKYKVCVCLLFLGFFVCTNIFHMMDMKYISVSINSLIYIEFMESDSSIFDNETFHASPFLQSTLNNESARTKLNKNATNFFAWSQSPTEASAPFVLRCDVLNVVVSTLPLQQNYDLSTELIDDNARSKKNRWGFRRRKRQDNIQIQFSASTALPPKKHFLVRSASLSRLDPAATTSASETSIVSAKQPFNFLRITFNKTITGSTDRFSRNISTRTVQFNPVELNRCLLSSLPTDYRCFWDGVETNSFFIDEAAQKNVSETISYVRPAVRHEFTGVTLWNVLHRLQSCDMADYVMNSIIEDSTTMNREKSTFLSFRGPSFDSSSVLLDAGYYRSYEHTAAPFCRYTSTMLLHALEQFLNRHRQYQTDRWRSMTLKATLTNPDIDNESISGRGGRLDDSTLYHTFDHENDLHSRISLNGTELTSDENSGFIESNVTTHRWLVAYIIVQYQPIESSYDPILVPVSTPRFSFQVTELSWRYNRHLHPPKAKVLGFDHIYQNICATAISMPLDGSTTDSASMFHTALAMQDCFDSSIWNQYKGSIVSCRYSIMHDLGTDNSIYNSPDDIVHCRHTLERTMQDILMQNLDA